jgi:hypothetical protein
METPEPKNESIPAEEVPSNERIIVSVEDVIVNDRIMKFYKALKKIVGQKIQMFAILGDTKINFINCNAIGDIMEDIVYSITRDTLPELRKGPPQKSPDFTMDGMEYELKTFYKTPAFDISNFNSFISQVSNPGGFSKISKCKYIIYEYDIDTTTNSIIIKNLYIKNIWELPSYTTKHPLSIQVKRGVWYNMRPGTKRGFSDKTKTLHKFIDSLIKCIEKCPQHIENKDEVIKTIREQFVKETET